MSYLFKEPSCFIVTRSLPMFGSSGLSLGWPCVTQNWDPSMKRCNIYWTTIWEMEWRLQQTCYMSGTVLGVWLNVMSIVTETLQGEGFIPIELIKPRHQHSVTFPRWSQEAGIRTRVSKAPALILGHIFLLVVNDTCAWCFLWMSRPARFCPGVWNNLLHLCKDF